MRRLPTTLAPIALAAALVLAACGTPPQTPIPLTLTGATPQVALPGETVTLSGSAFEVGHSVTFDGVPVTVASVAADGASMAVIVPDTAGYPVIAVEDVSLADALFVGHTYAGPLTLAGIQAALDPLPEGAALRVGAGDYTGTELTLDNRALYGAGESTVLQPTVGLAVLARSQNASVLADLRVEGGELAVSRGRLATADAEASVGFATALLTDLDLDVDLLRTPGADFVEVVLRDSAVTATGMDATAELGRLRIERSTITAPTGIVLQNLRGIAIEDTQLTATAGPLLLFGGAGIELTRSTLVGQDGLTARSQPGPLTLEEATVATDGPIQLLALGGLNVEDTTLTSDADAIAIQAFGGAALRASSLSAGTALMLDVRYGETLVEGSTLTSGGAIMVQASPGDIAWRSTVANAEGMIALANDGRLRVVGGAFASTADGLHLYATGHLVVDGTTIDAAGEVRVLAEGGTASVLDAVVTTTAASMVVNGGAVVVEGGSVSAAVGAFSLASTRAGDITLRGSAGITADAVVISAGAASFTGNNGTVTIVGNGPISATTTLVVDTPYSDLIVADNTSIYGGTLTVDGGRSHVTLSDNERLESGADLTIAAPDPGGRITATGNAFVADAGAGTITLDTVAGRLTQSGNVFTGTTSFPNNP